MNKLQLLKKLEEFPDDMDVFIEKTDIEFNLSLSEHVEIRDATFSDGTLKAKAKVIVITDGF